MKPIQATVTLLILTSALGFSHAGSAAGNTARSDWRSTIDQRQISVTPTTDNLFEEGLKKQEQEDYPGAIAAYTEFLKTHPERLEAYANRGFSKAMTNDLNGAIADFNRTLEIAPQDADAYNARGNAYAMTGNLNASIRDFSLAIKFDRNFADAYYNRGISRHTLGDRLGARLDITKAAELFRTQKDLGGYQQAREWIDKLQ